MGCFAFITIGAGLLLALFGQMMLRETAFPLFFLLTMIPLPEAIYTQLSEVMRIMTTWGSVGVLKLFNIPHYREGYDL